jgi:hypothetical protein
MIIPPNKTTVAFAHSLQQGTVDDSPEIVYNPKRTGIEFIKRGSQVLLRPNITYARQTIEFDIGMSFRAKQMVYIYAFIGREVPNGLTPANGTYIYSQHLRTSVSAFTDDGLGEVR